MPHHIGYVPQKLLIDAKLPLTSRPVRAALQKRPLFLGVSRRVVRIMKSCSSGSGRRTRSSTGWWRTVGGAAAAVLLALHCTQSELFCWMSRRGGRFFFTRKVLRFDFPAQPREPVRAIVLVPRTQHGHQARPPRALLKTASFSAKGRRRDHSRRSGPNLRRRAKLLRPPTHKKTHHKEHKGHKEKRKENRELKSKVASDSLAFLCIFLCVLCASW